jgi:hypothetical protein
LTAPRTVVADAAQAAVSGWRELLALSRPASWWLVAAPFAVGAYDAERTVGPALAIGLLYFTAPFGLLRFGLPVATGREPPDPDGPSADAVRLAIAITNLPLLAVLVLLGGPLVGLALLAVVVLAWLATLPQLGMWSRPGLDLVAAALLVVLPAATGLLLGIDPADLPWPALIGLGGWGAAVATIAAIAGSTGEGRWPTAPGTVEALGPQRSAVLADAGIVLAALLVAILGGLGVFAAIAVVAFVVAPLMILAASSDPDATRATAHDAVREMDALTIFAGFWLGAALLAHWGKVTWTPFGVAVVGSTILAGYALANTGLIWLTTQRRRAPATPDDAPVPVVSIVVPSHEAALDLPASLAGLRSQTYADFSIVVVDVGSTDGSREEAAAWLGADAVVAAPPMPDGWRPRAWACQVGADRTSSDLLLFVDLATALAPVAVRHLVERLDADRADLLSGLPRAAMSTPGQLAGVPGFSLLRVGFQPIWASAVTFGRRPAAFADDGLLLVRRAAYEVAGGHAAVRDGRHATALARRVAAGGGRVSTVYLTSLATTRVARDLGDAVSRWRRWAADRRSTVAGTLAIVLLEVAAFLLPLIVVPWALLADLDLVRTGIAFVPLVVLIGMRLLLAVTQRQPLVSILWHPVTIIAMLIGQGAGIVDHVVRPRT